MAQPLVCDLCHVEEGAYIIGSARDGSQVALCDECLVPWALTMLDERLNPETRRVLADHFAEGAAPAASESEPQPEPAPRRRGRQPAATPAETPPPAEEAQPAAADGR